MKVTSVTEMRELDKTAIEKFGIPDELLMENAGLASYTVLAREIGIKGKVFLIVCGLGNNGGDGFVVARKIHSAGGIAKIHVLGDCGKFKGPAKLNLDIIRQLPIELAELENAETLKRAITRCDCIVDAVFGTGLTRNVDGLYRQVLESMDESRKPIFSLDIPSGIHGDTGQPMGYAVHADHTVTFGLPKFGNMLYPGYEHCGKLHVSFISFPPAMYEKKELLVEINRPVELPPRARHAHKGSVGQALFIAGAASYIGAPYFAALSFLKAGGGYSRLAAPKSITSFIAAKGSEIVFVPQQETAAGSISLKNKETLLGLAEKMDMVVLGPGLSLHEETQRLVRELVREIHVPLLLDGDGITALCPHLDIIKERQGETVLTPHLGEMARLTGETISELDIHKITHLQNTARALRSTIVLKGAHSLIGYADGRVFINMSGNPGMASAGSGDVLTGAIAAMFGLGLPLYDAVRQGVFIHSVAGDLAARDLGEDGITAQDLLDYLPLAVRGCREGYDRDFQERYQGVSIV